VEVISLAYRVFEQPASTDAWLKAPHPLLHQASPLQPCRTVISRAGSGPRWSALEPTGAAGGVFGDDARKHRVGGAGAPQQCPHRPSLLCGYDVPDTPALIGEADPNALPKGWNATPHGQASAAFGGDWLRSGQQLGLVLPSVVVPQARNLLLDPLHPAIVQLALVHQEPLQLDQRLG